MDGCTRPEPCMAFAAIAMVTVFELETDGEGGLEVGAASCPLRHAGYAKPNDEQAKRPVL